MARSIIFYPNPILEQKTKDVVFPLDNYIREVIQDLWTLVADKGVGMAAPQIGESLNICIVNLAEIEEEAKKVKVPNFLMINPKIVFESQLECEMVEGCLSFPDQWYLINRPANIIVEFYDDKGSKKTLKAKEWLSRVIQHEIDHLQGKVFIKREGAKKLRFEDLEAL